MKKIYIFWIMFLFLIVLVQGVLAEDIGYVVRNTGNPDSNFINIINELGYSYELIDDSEISSTDFSEYKMILIGNERISNVPVNDYKSLVANTNYYENWSNSIGSSGGNIPLHAYNLNNLITEGVPTNFQVYTQCCSGGVSIPIYYLTGRKNNCDKITVLSSSTSDSGKYVIATKDNPKRVFFGITRSDYWTDDSRELFKNSLKWVVGEDNDGDGYYTGDDCNDNDASVWQNLGGYLDYDEDGFGTGQLIEVCSGSDLSEGYSYINEDCDDNNAFIHLGAEEIIDNINQNCVNDAPVFLNNIEEIRWTENEGEIINLNNYFKDPDGDSLSYSVYDTSEEIDIIVEIIGNIVRFSSSEDWIGEDWIIFKAEDSEEEYVLSNEVNLIVSEFNSPPIITSYSPENDLRILSNTEQLFSVVVEDEDSDVSIDWEVDGINIGEGSEYLFNRGEGDYNVKAIVSDEETSINQLWNIFVRGADSFTCEEMNGYVCSSEQICLGNLLGVSDSNSCCAVECSEKPLEFNNANTCDNLNNKVKISFEDLSENDEFKIGRKINFKIKLKNDFNEDFNFDVKVYLYDLTKEKIIKKDKDSFDVKTGETEFSEFEFEVPVDLNEDNEYVVFAVVENSEDECNQDYMEIDIKRNERDVYIEEFEISRDYFACGDYINSEIKVQNMGTEDNDVYVIVKSSELGINEKSENFELEKYGEDDSETKEFILKISDGVAAGEYILNAEVYFNSKKTSSEIKLVLDECKKQNVVQEPIEEIKLSGVLSEVSSDKSLLKKLVFVMFLYVLMGGIVYGGWLVYNGGLSGWKGKMFGFYRE